MSDSINTDATITALREALVVAGATINALRVDLAACRQGREIEQEALRNAITRLVELSG